MTHSMHGAAMLGVNGIAGIIEINTNQPPAKAGGFGLRTENRQYPEDR